ncbi:MAG: hypothetical protein WBA12_04070, partial [Catalinimonas sp.]
IDLFGLNLKRLRATNFILRFVEKPRRCSSIAYVFRLAQYKICTPCSFIFSPNKSNSDKDGWARGGQLQ